MSVHDEIAANVKQLVHGWYERIEYKIRVHDAECADDIAECDCPTEQRVKRVAHAGLLAQLKDYAENGDPGPRDGAERGSPNKGGSRPPGPMQGFNLLDEITCEAAMLADTALTDTRGDRSYALRPVGRILDMLVMMARDLGDEHAELLAAIRHETREWVRRARRVLAHDEQAALLPQTVCGGCGGALVLGGGPGAAVRCIGGQDRTSCGVEYKRGDWLALYEQTRGEPDGTA